ncbi:unnamed protein product [Spodoptera exigua]|nr:unnamed protein product [Spodoptera exigua]
MRFLLHVALLWCYLCLLFKTSYIVSYISQSTQNQIAKLIGLVNLDLIPQ